MSTNLSSRDALLEVRKLFRSGAQIFPRLAYVGTACALWCAYNIPAKRSLYYVAAAGNLAIAPFTVAIMLPLANQRLIDLHEGAAKGEFDGQKGLKEVDDLLKRFGMLNAWRAGLMAVGGLAALYCLE